VNRSFNRAAPSNIEYSVCTCRCTNESPTPAPLVIARADGRPRTVAASLVPPTDRIGTPLGSDVTYRANGSSITPTARSQARLVAGDSIPYSMLEPLSNCGS
jgi:hypothetical protein